MKALGVYKAAQAEEWIGFTHNLYVINLLSELKFSLCFFFNWAQCHEGVLGSEGIALHIIGLYTRWRWVVSFTPCPLYP
jgi:hypothetical protein